MLPKSIQAEKIVFFIEVPCFFAILNDNIWQSSKNISSVIHTCSWQSFFEIIMKIQLSNRILA